MTAVTRFREALKKHEIPDPIQRQIFQDHETVSDRSKKEKKAAFFIDAIDRMDKLLDPEKNQAIRDSCACSKGGWRLKAMKKIAKEYSEKSIEEKLAAIGEVKHMGNPQLNPDDTITASIGETGGFVCPCPVFHGVDITEPVSITYCYCCAGHFRHHYQIALNMKLETVTVLSSALESQRTKPCKFVYRII
ncbi:MAG: hypothetical protein NWF07_07465 [Candidatus Bathyarchaeota archaeon]|nr:hypothetical protein [Candidatus Bathyarchaeota archaeon]